MTAWTREEQAEHRKLWVAALRSGEYQQIQGWLADDKGLCCLGVACEVAVATGAVDGYNREGYVLPDAIQAFLGLNSAQGDLHSEISGCEKLTSLNDDAGYSFDQIADVIERGEVQVQ